MQEYNDGSFGNIMEADKLKEVLSNPMELAKTKKIHFGTYEELQAMKQKVEELEDKRSSSVKDCLLRVEDKLDMIIKHFRIVRIIGDAEYRTGDK